MTKYDSSNVKVEFDNSGGNLINMTSYVDGNFELGNTVETVESTCFGDTWRAHLAGLKDSGTITISGWYDDTATVGPDAIFNSLGSTRTLKVTWGGSKTSQQEVTITGYKRTASVGTLTRYEVTLLGAGALAEA
jgi:hypothetical protein